MWQWINYYQISEKMANDEVWIAELYSFKKEQREWIMKAVWRHEREISHRQDWKEQCLQNTAKIVFLAACSLLTKVQLWLWYCAVSFHCSFYCGKLDSQRIMPEDPRHKRTQCHSCQLGNGIRFVSIPQYQATTVLNLMSFPTVVA